MDLAVAHPQLARQATHRQLGAARLLAVVADKVAVERQFYPAGFHHRVLEGGVTAGVPAGVEVGKAVQWRTITGRIVQQMIGAKPQATAQTEDLLAHRAVHFPRVAGGVLLGKSNADLHRPPGVHRVKGTEQLLPHRHHPDKVIKNGAQLLFRLHIVQTVAIAFTVWRGDLQRGMDQKRRNVHFFRPAVNFLPGDFIQPRHHRIGLIVRLLLRDRQHRADVFFRRRQLLAVKRGGDGLRPGLPILDAGRHFLPHHRRHVNRLLALFQRRSLLAGTGAQRHGRQQRQ